MAQLQDLGTSRPQPQATIHHQPLFIEGAIADPSAYLRSGRKRMLDIVAAVFGLTLLVAAIPLVALATAIFARGPLLYRQTRLGLDGRPFTLIKFRTMFTDAEATSGPVWSASADHRITCVGRFLRRTYVDEFPQWMAVLKGQMSAVGPRPERPELSRLIERDVPGFSHRLVAKPGVTGWAQVKLGYSSSIESARNKLAYDLEYVSRASLRLDMKIMAMTLMNVVRARGT